MREIKGRLLYTGAKPHFPWKIAESEYIEIHLLPAVDRFFTSLNGKLVRHELGRNSYTLVTNEMGMRFEYTGGLVASRSTHLNETLVWLSGRVVEVEIEDGKRIMLAADKSERVFGVRFTSGGNFCKVSNNDAQTVCRVGRQDKCVFLSESVDGFHCSKFVPKAFTILEQLPKDNVRGAHIGSCALL
jgi:hypothetical protein